MDKMSEMKRLEADLEASEELRAKLQETARKIADSGEATSDGDALAKAAAELGYEISVGDIEKIVAEAQELDDEELAAITGGNLINGDVTLLDGPLDNDMNSAWCLAAWHCYTAFLHTEGGTKDEKCWSSYECVYVFE